MGQIRCDAIAFQGYDCQRQKTWFLQGIPDPSNDELKAFEDHGSGALERF